MSATESVPLNILPEFTSDEVEKKIYGKTLGILIGKGMSFNNDKLEISFSLPNFLLKYLPF